MGSHDSRVLLMFITPTVDLLNDTLTLLHVSFYESKVEKYPVNPCIPILYLIICHITTKTHRKTFQNDLLSLLSQSQETASVGEWIANQTLSRNSQESSGSRSAGGLVYAAYS